MDNHVADNSIGFRNDGAAKSKGEKRKRLWTSMPKEVYESTLLKTVEYICDSSKCDMLLDGTEDKQFERAYAWLETYMAEKIGPAPAGVIHPVWAWYKLRGRNERPDLRWTEFRVYKKPMVLLELEIADGKVVLSDEEKWTCAQLNDSAWCETDAELAWYYDNPNINQHEREAFKTKSWYRIFDIEKSENVQATFWKLISEDIRNVWSYNNRKNLRFCFRAGPFIIQINQFLL